MTTAMRTRLRSKASHVEDLIENEVEVDYRKVEDAVLDLANALPAGTEDYEAKQLFVYLTELRRAIDDGGDVQLAAMRMADVARRLERRLGHAALENPEEAVRFTLANLEPLSVTEVARLLGVSTKTVGAWRSGKPVRQRVDRVLLVAQLVWYLRYGMTATGLRLWFENPADLLGGKSPLELLDDDVRAAWEPLVAYARGGRGQLAG
jgi:transcriptional regulator with XRE-family HTH domain